MDVLQVMHEDFTLQVSCKHFPMRYSKALMKQPDLNRATGYKVSDGQIEIVLPEDKVWISAASEKVHPVFFENTDYHFWIEFRPGKIDDSPQVISRQRDEESKFNFHDKSKVLTGVLNYGNEIGSAVFRMQYQCEGRLQEFSFNYEVFPIKLNYRIDYANILEEIQQEYPLLVLDFLKKTYQSFSRGHSESCDVIWWQIFGGIYADFSKAVNYVLNKPHQRLQQHNRYLKADRIRNWTPALEEEYANAIQDKRKYYRTQYKTLTVDTPENRFLKYALRNVTVKFHRITNHILANYSEAVSDSFRQELGLRGRELERYSRHPFLKGVSSFRGLRQESLVLQRATGYNTVYKCWIMLRMGMSFLEGVQKLETKNIADLYQIWCFLKVKNILQQLLGKPPEQVDLAHINIDRFVIEFQRGNQSRVLFQKDNGDTVEIFHDYQYQKSDTRAERSFTVVQRPDIVVKLTKNDLQDNYAFTYLYDAKYRLQSDDDETKPDFPPDDAINQMHRYRDAIYYSGEGSPPQKEVIGGYILFPGSGDKAKILGQAYFKSIDHVNIGAFPLRPGSNDDSHQDLLMEHFKSLIDNDSSVLFEKISPQKGTRYETSNPEVLLGHVKYGEQTRYFLSETGGEWIYHTGRFENTSKEEFLRINENVKYFAPNFSGRGVSSIFTISKIEYKPRNEIFPKGHPLHHSTDTSNRIVFYLTDKQYIKLGEFIQISNKLYDHRSLMQLRSAFRVS